MTKLSKYSTIIWDIDGTLLNTLDMNMYPLMKIIEEETGEVWSYEEVLKFAAYPGLRVMEELSVEDIPSTYARWVKYVNEYEEGATLYSGVREVVESLSKRGYTQAVVSAKTKAQYSIDMGAKGLDKYMAKIILANDTKNHKPHPEPLIKCMLELGVKPSDILYIGDAASDGLATKYAGIDFGYAKWGNVLKENLEATYTFNSPEDILKLI